MLAAKASVSSKFRLSDASVILFYIHYKVFIHTFYFFLVYEQLKEMEDFKIKNGFR